MDPYDPGSSTAGFIYYYGGQPRFFSLWHGIDDPKFLPHNCTICSSTNGLLLCHYPRAVPITPSRRYAYVVCNPFLRRRRREIRNPPNGPHPDGMPRVLVVNVTPTASNRAFHVVCAVPAAGTTGYSYEVYSSGTDQWRASHRHVLGRIREETGVSCSSRAYWLVDEKPLAAYYDTANHEFGTVDLTRSQLCRQLDAVGRHQTQLGECEGNLCLVEELESEHAVYTFYVDVNMWFCNYRRPYRSENPPVTVSRFGESRLQVPFWFDDGILVVCRCTWPNEPVSFWRFRGPTQRDPSADILPVVRTQLHPIRDFRRFA